MADNHNDDDGINFGAVHEPDDLNFDDAFQEYSFGVKGDETKGIEPEQQPAPAQAESLGKCANCPAPIPRKLGLCLTCAVQVSLISEYTLGGRCKTCNEVGAHKSGCTRILVGEAAEEAAPVTIKKPPAEPTLVIPRERPVRAKPKPVPMPAQKLPPDMQLAARLIAQTVKLRRFIEKREMPKWTTRRLALIGAVATFLAFPFVARSGKAAPIASPPAATAPTRMAPLLQKPYEVTAKKRIRLAMPAPGATPPAAVVVRAAAPQKRVELRKLEPREEAVEPEPEVPEPVEATATKAAEPRREADEHTPEKEDKGASHSSEFNTEVASRLKKLETETVGWIGVHGLEPTFMKAEYAFNEDHCEADVSAKYEVLFSAYLESVDQVEDVAQRTEIAKKAKLLGHNLAELKGDRRCEPKLRRDNNGRTKIYTAMAKLSAAQSSSFVPRSKLQRDGY